MLDDEVNKSAVTKLAGGWRNVNQRSDPRNWFEKLLGLNSPGKVSRGVRKLRDREAGEAGHGMRIMLSKAGEDDGDSINIGNLNESSTSVDMPRVRGAGGRRLDDIHSIDSHRYPPTSLDLSTTSLPEVPMAVKGPTTESGQGQFSPGSLAQYQQSIHSRSSFGVLDLQKRAGGLARWERTLWKKLEVGDIVLLRENEQVPADIVVLSTSDADGMCYLETKNLDGETNLKPRRSVRATSTIKSEDDIERSSFCLDSEPPHQNLYLYHGVLKYKDATTGEQKQEPATINELLLRGCAIRNTNWVIGLVVFTGADTKIMLNGGDTPSKQSKIEKETNYNVIVNFLVLTVLCIISAIFYGLYDGQKVSSADFFEAGSDPTTSVIINSIVTFVYVLSSFSRSNWRLMRITGHALSPSKTWSPSPFTSPLKL